MGRSHDFIAKPFFLNDGRIPGISLDGFWLEMVDILGFLKEGSGQWKVTREKN